MPATEHTSRATYERDLRRYVLPRFGDYRIGSVPAEETENWVNDGLDAGIAPSSVHRHYRTLRRMFQVATDKQKIVANPCDRVTPPRVPKKEMVLLDWDEVIELATAYNQRFQTLILFAVETGMRWSELVGLRPGRLDLRTGRVRVTEQLIRTEDSEWTRKGPKTDAGVRSISLSSVVVEAMRDRVREFPYDGPDGLVLPSSRGTSFVSSSFLTHHFGPGKQPACPAGPTTSATPPSRWPSPAGAHPKAIQTRMDHSSVTVTLDRYGHVPPSSTRRSPARSATKSPPPGQGTSVGW